jgi:hypothetical protein
MSKLGKAIRVAKTAGNIAKAENKGQAVGNLAAGAAMIAHPIVGTMLAPAIRKGTERAVNTSLDKISEFRSAHGQG